MANVYFDDSEEDMTFGMDVGFNDLVIEIQILVLFLNTDLI